MDISRNLPAALARGVAAPQRSLPDLARPFILSFTASAGSSRWQPRWRCPSWTAAASRFPRRDLILLLTFWVILVTLVAKDCCCRPLIGWLGLPRSPRREQIEERKAELAARRTAIMPSRRGLISLRKNAAFRRLW